MDMHFPVPVRDEMSPQNQEVYDGLKKNYGFVPNMFAMLAYSKTAFPALVALQQSHAKGAFNLKEREAINLVVSQANHCAYCTAAHTAAGKMAGYTDEQLLEIRKGNAPFDPKLDAAVKLAQAITIRRGYPAPHLLDAFFAAGYDRGALVDLTMLVGDRMIINYLHAMTKAPIDFPEAPAL